MISRNSKFKMILFWSLTIVSMSVYSQKTAETSRKTINFDSSWRFLKGDANGAEAPGFNDSEWRLLDVPHDWSIEGQYDKENPTSRGGGYLPAGIGWYRKDFTVTPADINKKIFIEFDGVMANSDVWINGYHLGKRPYGYSSFSYDLTDNIKKAKGEKNVIAVRADNTIQPASRYYAGAGIYRHVRLVLTDPVHFEQWGIFISASQVTGKKAIVKALSTVLNESSGTQRLTVETLIFDPSGKEVKSVQTSLSIMAGKSSVYEQELEVTNPVLWDIDNPVLYTAVTRLKSASKTIDEQSNTFGLRDSRFEAATGYWLNGKNIKIKGVCLHHDMGALGSAVPAGAWERRLELLKEAGVNAIRTGHNPFAPEFLDICDQMGFLVMDETFDTWTAAKPNGEQGYNRFFREWWDKDTRSMVLRDRNHPSIIIYSVGNEIRDNLNDSTGFKKYRDQQDLVHSLDPTRPVTMALFRPNVSRVYSNGFAEMMDIVGQNYRENELVALHEAKPGLKVIGTENGHGLTEWLILRDKPYMAGQFLWIGVDYLGEALWPAISYNKGLFDRTGGWNQLGLQRQSWWSDKPVVHIARKEFNAGEGEWIANWTPVDLGTYDDARVQVYSNCEKVELFLNGKSLGSLDKPADDSPRDWEVTFEKGVIKAVGSNGGKVAATEEFTTAGVPVGIILKADYTKLKKSWDDLSYISATIVDADGVRCPNSDNLVSFVVSEEGELAAVDNGDTNSHESYRGSERHAFHGECIAIVKAAMSKGTVKITATSPGLKSGTAEIVIN